MAVGGRADIGRETLDQGFRFDGLPPGRYRFEADGLFAYADVPDDTDVVLARTEETGLWVRPESVTPLLAALGLRGGDRILSVDGAAFPAASPLAALLDRARVSTVRLGIVRDGVAHHLDVDFRPLLADLANHEGAGALRAFVDVSRIGGAR